MAAVTLYGPDNMPLPPRKNNMRDLAQRLRADMGFGDGFGGRPDDFYDAASYTHQDLAAWTPSNPSGQTALTWERDPIASRVHALIRNDGWAAASVTRYVDSVIGAGWILCAAPDAKALNISDEAADDLAAEIEESWEGYAFDFESCDASQRFTIGMLQALALRHRMGDGEDVSLSRWIDRNADWCTAIQPIDPDRLSNPNLYLDSTTRRAGVEMGAYGEPTAYWFRSAHPGDWGVINAWPWIWEKVDRKLPNGRWQVVHGFTPKRAGQVRGEPPLSPVLKKLRMLGRYDEAELQAAVLNAILAAFITSPNDHDQIAEALQGSEEISKLQESRMGFYGARGLKMPGVKMNFLFPTDQIDLLQPQHPNGNFDAFMRAGLRNVASATGVTYEQLSMDWSQSNYTNMRAAFLEVHKGFHSTKEGFAAQYMRPHYSNWLEEAIARGRVKIPKGAPPFRAARNAYCKAHWLGVPRGWVDPIKESQAAMERIQGGLSTFQRECAEQGINYRKLFKQRGRERREMIAEGLDPDAMLRPKLPQGTQPGDGPLPAPPKEPKTLPKGDGEDD